MSDNDEKKQPPGSIEDQFREMLKKANVSFFMGPGGAAPAGGTAPTEEEDGEAEEDERLQAIRTFDLRPRDIRDYLDRFVIKQEEAKKVLSVAICDHYNHVRRCIEDPAAEEREYAKHNILLLGPTGVGKTYLMRCIARLIGVPFVKADATKFSETGYVGHDVEDLVRDLVKASDGNTELASYGIIFLDEVDKIAAQSTAGGKDVSGRGVQINLLKLMEETDVSLVSQTDILGQMQAVMDMQRGGEPAKRTINTRHMLFIVSGAFGLLAEQVQKRIATAPIGFKQEDAGERTETDYLREAGTKDFIDYGFEPEFIGRLPVRVVCDGLDVDDLEAILSKAEGSILGQYRDDFRGYNIDLRLLPDAIRAIAEQAHPEQTGARGLMTVMERIFRDFKFELPSAGIDTFELGRRTVKDPAGALRELLAEKDRFRREAMSREIAAFAERFQREHGLKLVFDDDAEALIVDRCLAEDRSVRGWIERHFHDLEYGLKLIARNTGNTEFRVTRGLVESPEAELSERIAGSFRR